MENKYIGIASCAFIGILLASTSFYFGSLYTVGKKESSVVTKIEYWLNQDVNDEECHQTQPSIPPLLLMHLLRH